MVIAIVNSKGGVGKTTTSIGLAAALARADRRVLLVDLDSQASASAWCGVPPARLRPSSATCLLEGYPAVQAVRGTKTAHLDLITGSLELANADLALCDRPERELALQKTLAPVRGRYGVVLLDCPPGLSLLTITAIMAADALIVPVVPRQVVLDHLPGLTAAIDKVRLRLGARPRLLGLLLTMAQSRTPRDRAAAQRLRGQHLERVFQTEIPFSTAIEDAAAAGEPVLSFAPKSPAASAYRRLALEVLQCLASRH